MINIQKFLEKFEEEYDFLYEHRDNVAGYREAVAWFDEFSEKHPDFVMEFVKYRHDFISSDREAASFAFTMESFGLA